MGFLTRTRAEAVCERLDTFVAPSLEREEAEGLSDVDWIRVHNAKVRVSLKGAADLVKRLNGEDDEETKESLLPTRPIKGEAFMAKMIEQRMRRRLEPEVGR